MIAGFARQRQVGPSGTVTMDFEWADYAGQDAVARSPPILLLSTGP